VLADVVQRGGLAEAGHVGVLTGILLAAPGVVGVGDLFDFLVGEFAPGAVHHHAHLAGVDEQHLPAAVAQLGFLYQAVVASFGQNPEAGGDLGGVEELARQRHHAVHHVGLDHGLADFAFAALLRAHGAVGQHHARGAVGGEVVVDVLDPRIVGVAHGRYAELPAHVFAQALAAPVGDVERRVGEDEVELEVAQLVLVEAAFVVPADVGIDAAHRQVHLAQPPGGVVALLSVDGDVPDAAAVLHHELFRLHEHTAGAAAGVVDAAGVGLQHFHQHAHHRARGVEL